MRRTSVWMVVAIALVLTTVMWRPAASQDSALERLDDLSTRVSVLEDKVDELERSESSNGGVAPESSSDNTIRGVVTIRGFRNSQVSEDGNTCRGVGEEDERFAGLEGGEPVWVWVDNKVVASDELETGEFVENYNDQTRVTCNFVFRIEGVPDADVYQVAVGEQGWYVELTYDEMEDADWRVEIGISF